MAKDIFDNTDKYLELNILICGKTGIGKSTLINSLVGEEICSVGDPGKKFNTSDSEKEDDDDEDDVFGAETKQLQPHYVRINGVPVFIWDSPGLQDGTANEDRYLEMMYDLCSDVDLVLYCQDMTTSRWTRPEIEATRLLTRKFGVEFWEKCVLVLTKANAVCPDLRFDETEYDYWKRLHHNFVTKFRSQLKKQGVPGEIADDIPGVAAGRVGHNPKDRYLWYVTDKGEETVKTREKQDFLSEFWLTCFERTPGLGREKMLDMSSNNRIISTDACSEETAIYWRHMHERESYYAELERQVDPRVTTAEEMKVLFPFALAQDYWQTTYKPFIGTSTQAQCTRVEPTPQVSPSLYDLNYSEEKMKRINDKLESDRKQKSGFFYRTAKWVKSRFSKKK